MIDWEYYQKISGSYGFSNFNEQRNYESQQVFAEILESSPEKATIIIDGITTKAIIHHHLNPLNEDKEDRRVQVISGTKVHRGSMIVWNNENWMVFNNVTVNDDNGTYIEAKILGCTNILTLLSTTTGSPVSYPCILSSDSYSVSGLNESKLFITDSKKRTVLVPYNDDTKRLFLQERLMFNHADLYEINTIDHDSYFCNPEGELTEGILKLTLESTVEIVGKDDKSLNLAYNENQIEVPTIPIGEYVVSIIGDDTINADSNKIYTAKIYNNSIEVTNLPVTWDLLDVTGINVLTSAVAYLSDVVNNSITINAVKSDNYITLKATLNADVSKIATLQIYVSSGW